MAAAVVVVCALLMASCSSGSHSEGSRSDAPATTTASSATVNRGSGGGAFCNAARQFAKDQAAIQHQASDKAAVLRSAQDAERASSMMQSSAPDSLKADVQRMISGFKPFFDALIQAGGAMTKALGVQQRLQPTVTSPQFQAATRAVDNYEVKACGLSPSGR